MSELLILSLPRADVVTADCTARGGDETAVVFLEGLFEPYRDRELACFLYDAGVLFPPHCSIVGDLATAQECDAVPLCSDCSGLPRRVKWGRVLKLLRAMHKFRTGNDLYYQLRRR